MELVYRVCCPDRQDIHSIPEHCLCAVSRRNIVAFTMAADLLQEKEAASKMELVHRVFVCDLGNPAQVFAVTKSSHLYVALQWDREGDCLLIADKGGNVQIHSMQNGLLNSWLMNGKAKLQGEQILVASWTPSSYFYALNLDRRDAMSYLDKFRVVHSAKPFIPTSFWSGYHGFVVVTASGMVSLGLMENTNLSKSDIKVEMVSTLLSFPMNRHLSVAAVSFPPSGGMALATSDGDLWAPVNCCKITAEYKPEVSERFPLGASLCLCMEQLPGLSVYCARERAFAESAYTRITQMLFVSPYEHEILLVAVSNHTDSRVEVWKLKEEPVKLSREVLEMAGLSQSSVRATAQNWKFHNSTKHHSPVTSMAVPELELFGNQDTMCTLPVHVAIGYHDAIVLLLNRHLFQSVAHARTEPLVATEEVMHKTNKIRATPMHLQQTWSGCGLVCVDQRGDLYLYRLVNCTDPETRTPDRDIVTLLEYSMLAGYDRLDVLMAVNEVNQRALCSVLRENHACQTSSATRPARLLPVLAQLSQCCAGTLQEADDLFTYIYCHTLRNHMFAMLAAKDLQEKTPAEMMTAACNHLPETDLDQLLVRLHEQGAHPCLDVFIDEVFVQSMRQIFQWVAEIGVYVAAVASIQPHTPPGPCATLVRNSGFLRCLRDILLLVYSWGQQVPGCLPQLTSANPTLRPLPAMFSIITKLLDASTGEASVATQRVLQDEFLDECACLVHQLHPPRLSGFSPRPAPLLLACGSPPRHLTFCAPWPEHTDLSPERFALAHVLGVYLLPVGHRDSIRKGYLDGARQRCLRCCRTTNMDENSVTATVREPLFAFVDKWRTQCLCGGPWVLG